MASSLGFDAVTSCAAARAGLTRPDMLDFWVEDTDVLEAVPVAGRTMGWYTEGFEELGRLVQLGRPAVRDVVRSAALDAPQLERSAWVVNLADGYHETQARRVLADTTPEAALETIRPPYEHLWPWFEERLMPGLLSALPHRPNRAPARLLYKGTAGAAVALAEARRVLTENRVETCLVGGIDALVDGRWLDALYTLGILKTPVDAAGITPGEAAVFLCLETVESARRRGATVRAVLGEPAVGRDPAHRFHESPPSGVVLASVIQSAAGTTPNPVCYAGLAGDALGAAEWGRAWVRLQNSVTFSEVSYPATAFGATGAASGFVSTAVALHAFSRTALDSALVWEASDDGLRGAFSLTRPR